MRPPIRAFWRCVMKRIISLLLVATLLVPLAACGGGSVETNKLTVWHDKEDAVIEALSAYLAEAAPEVEVVFEKKTSLTDSLKLVGNDPGSAPDMFIFAHDKIGVFAEMGILADVNTLLAEGALDNWLPMTIEAASYKGMLYQLPLYFETLLFIYNKALWQGDIPATTEELYEYMAANTDTAAGTYAVVNQHSTAYNVSPFINGFGGYIIDENANPGLNDAKTIEAVEYNKKFAALQADGDYNTVTTLFNEGKAAAIIGGPWLVSGIRAAGIDFGVASLSDMTLPNGNALAPYSGVQGVGVMKVAAEAKGEAIALALEALASPEVGIALAKSSGCAPASVAAYDDPDVAADEIIAAIGHTAETAQPMPNIAEMSVMWGPAESMLAAVNKNGEDVASAAETAQAAALQAIADMQ